MAVRYLDMGLSPAKFPLLNQAKLVHLGLLLRPVDARDGNSTQH